MHTMNKRFPILWMLTILSILCSCSRSNHYLKYALEAAGDNRPELEKVLAHYKGDSLKYLAAVFLIENMPGHYSYQGEDVLKYYEMAKSIFRSGLTPVQQRDSLLKLSREKFPYLKQHLVHDISIIKADFLIQNIDQAFDQWETRPWAEHLSFEQFCEYLLPYKCSELQQFDNWRDTLSERFGDPLASMLLNDESYESTYNAAITVRKEIKEKINPHGMFNESGYPFLSASTMHRITFGRCIDYVNLAVATMRSLGIPAMIDETPQWGRYRAGHSWYTILNDKGEFLSSEWDVSTSPGKCFFPYKRIPKIFRQTYAVNRHTVEYLATAKYRHPFNPFSKDVTDQYFATSDLSIPVIRKDLKDKYVYISLFNERSGWFVVDYGTLHKNKAVFKNLGRNVLYLALGFDGKGLVPISYPFILHKNGDVEYVMSDTTSFQKVVLKRKYPTNENVVNMQHRVLQGVIQASNQADFSNAQTLFTIDNLDYPDKILLSSDRPYRFWRYLSPKGSYGNIAELQFFIENKDGKDELLTGKMISSNNVGNDTVKKAFDGNWLTNFETGSPDGSWVGMDFGKPIRVQKVRCIPRNDDNFIHTGHKYELKFWNNSEWKVIYSKVVNDNVLAYDSVPAGALLWLKDKWGGWDERVFLYKDGKQEWW